MRNFLIAFLVLFWVASVSALENGGPGFITSGGSGGSGSLAPGLVGETLSAQGVEYLKNLREFTDVGGQMQSTVYIDPIEGSDVNGDGSYDSPYQSFYYAKREGFSLPFTRTVVKDKGQDVTWWTRTLLTVSYGASSTRHLQVGDIITYASPAGTALIEGVYGNKIAANWLSGEDPRVGSASTTFSVGTESVGTVDKVENTINGWRSTVIPAANILPGTDTINASGHDYENGAGPFLWFNETTMPTTTPVNALEEAVTRIYICNIVAGVSFQIQDDPTCGSGAIDITSIGTGDNQIIAGMDNNLGKTLIGTQDMSACPDRDNLCALLEPENNRMIWGLAGGNRQLVGARSYITRELFFWPSYVSPGTYVTPTGVVFGAYQDGLVNDPAQNSWLGIQNGIVKNLCSGVFTTSSGGKLARLNVDVLGICNGQNDRSVEAETNTGKFAHASDSTATGENTEDAGALGSVLWHIGGTSSHASNSNLGSAGMYNPNEHGFLGLITNGTMLSDASATANCDTVSWPCPNTFVVQPGGDLFMHGPHVRTGGNSGRPTGFTFGGTDTRQRVYNTVVEMFGTDDRVDISVSPIWNVNGGGQDAARFHIFKNTTFQIAGGPRRMFSICPLLGDNRLTANSTLDANWTNVIFDGFSGDYWGAYNNCGVNDLAQCIGVDDPWVCCSGPGTEDSPGACGWDHEDAVSRMTWNVEGSIWDEDDATPCAGRPCNNAGISAREMGNACGDCNAANCFLNDICTNTDSQGVSAPSGAWTFDVTTNDRTPAAAQWRTTDKQLRCEDDTKECWLGGSLTNLPEIVSVQDAWRNTKNSCLPKAYLGARVCKIEILSAHIGAR